ncbi:multiple sugar transport system permease protein/raffinose/stachyose/melibiose transport system permease protein [Ruminiclostridium sufflavum DSM 19573]|uniref:Multiple sugar transport system permease protein/raffinose/stachyose/melibiose transport system permease protein n=1 Tax=Ruminiclostridium sufflavum DSM 19573 TaxID=1121337 RepID=A0A318XPY7_9FIRM|nr:carbohydrate ABC transporter permease [Ruminiclostridium sufflavum]PYG90401.1 multiple sugar transport system permease protein/raffinose/stachyose/melibiose transport system permease protein [Ruminiclostridium sufflavum DSM 19573]
MKTIHSAKGNSLIYKAISQVFMLVMTLLILFPIYFMFINSFKSRPDFIKNPIGLPAPFTVQSFLDAFAGKNFVSWFGNSIFLMLASIVITTLFSCLAAFAFARMDFKGSKTIFNMMIPLMSIPPIIMLIPLYKVMAVLNLVNTRASVILIYSGIMVPFTIFLLKNFFANVPKSLTEAAFIDGATQFQTFYKIIIPLSKSALITASIVNIVWVWNELLIALVFLQDESMRTIIVGLTLFKSRYTLNVPVIMAGLSIATIPMLLVYIFGQRYLVQGLLSGAVKE